MTITVDVATAVINEAKNHEVYDGPLPTDPAKRIGEASNIIDQARAAAEAGIKNDAVNVILNLASSVGEASPAEVAASVPETSEPDPVSVVPAAVEADVSAGTSGVDSQADQPDAEVDQSHHPHHTLTDAIIAKETAIARIKQEGLPIPPELKGDPPVLPRDLTELTDAQLRRLHSEYSAALARANYIAMLESADEYAAKVISEKLYARAVANVDKSKREGDRVKNKTIPEIEAEAAQDPDYGYWVDKHHNHHAIATLYKSMRDGYKDTCERLSREWSMREGERNFSAR